MPEAKLPPMTEAQFTRQVIQLAQLYGWISYHTHDSRRSTAGFPDLVFVRDRIVWAELKAERGQLRTEQVAWLYRLERAGAEVYCWRPSSWPDIERILA